jgi:hypothetical protein
MTRTNPQFSQVIYSELSIHHACCVNLGKRSRQIASMPANVFFRVPYICGASQPLATIFVKNAD